MWFGLAAYMGLGFMQSGVGKEWTNLAKSKETHKSINPTGIIADSSCRTDVNYTTDCSLAGFDTGMLPRLQRFLHFGNL